MSRLAFIYGTRPEAIKMAPLVLEAEQTRGIEADVLLTGQHREMLQQVHEFFRLKARVDLDLMTHGQSLNSLFSRSIAGIGVSLESLGPDAVVVQGDTTTSTAGALAAFHLGIPVVHVEAGLRSHDLASPFPEEGNRQLTSRVASLHLAPTRRAKSNLVREGIESDQVAVTGNTVIDALQLAVKNLPEAPTDSRPFVLVTTHRRENWGARMVLIAAAIEQLSQRFAEVDFVLPMHKNPDVRGDLQRTLGSRPNVRLLEPFGYVELVTAMRDCVLVMTDSGGIQEEAPSLGKPVIVMRDTTERPEAVESGNAVLVDPRSRDLAKVATELLTSAERYDAMARAVNPYGDGLAAGRSMAAIKNLLGLGERLPDFCAGAP